MTVHRSRRSFLGNTFSAALTAALIQAQPFLKGCGWLDAAHAVPDMTYDAFNGLFAFVLPGSDAYSIAQGVSTADQGGVDTGTIDVFIRTVDASTPFFPNFSAQVAAILNGLATSVNPSGGGTMVSPFANLTFARKAAVFQIMDATPTLELFGGLLPAFVAFFCYSEAGTFNPVTRSLSGKPLGWTLCHYQGVADGRDELLGYLPNVPRNPR